MLFNLIEQGKGGIKFSLTVSNKQMPRTIYRDDAMLALVGVRITAADKVMLKDYAKKIGRDVSSIIRELLYDAEILKP